VFSPTTPTDQASLMKILGFENEHSEDKPGGCPGCADRKDGALISTSTVQTFNLQPALPQKSDQSANGAKYNSQGQARSASPLGNK